MLLLASSLPDESGVGEKRGVVDVTQGTSLLTFLFTAYWSEQMLMAIMEVVVDDVGVDEKNH